MDHPDTFHHLIYELITAEHRSDAAREFAHYGGASDLVFFVLDREVGALITALGFPPTMPDASGWAKFVEDTAKSGSEAGALTYPLPGQTIHCLGRSTTRDAVVVFIGGEPRVDFIAQVIDVMPILRVLFQAEQAVLNANATTALARNATRQLRSQAASLEQARRMANSELIERHKAEEALRVNAAELERSNRDLQQFAGIVSHDLQEPLRMVSSYLGLIEMRYAPLLDDKAQEYIGLAISGSQRMSQLIKALLGYAQVGADERTMVPVPLEAVLIEAQGNLEARIVDTNASIQCTDLPSVKGDHVLLVQLFQNLLVNAIKFSRKGTAPVIRVTAVDQGSTWLISVADNGIGILPSDHSRIFGVFQRLHSRDAYEGCGIGLATCKRIMGRHGGHIAVASEVGVGSTFTLSFPKSGSW